jgi:hypothetical protein
MDSLGSVLPDELNLLLRRLDKGDLALVDPHARVFDLALLLLLAFVLRQEGNRSAVKRILLRFEYEVHVRVRHVAGKGFQHDLLGLLASATNDCREEARVADLPQLQRPVIRRVRC